MGYSHTFEKKNKYSSLWRCSNRKCPGSVTWVEEDGTVARDSDHSCMPDVDALKVAKIMEELKKAVCDDYGPIQQIFEKYVMEFRKNTEYDGIIPTFDSVKDTLYRARKKHLEVHATVFKTLETVVLPRRLTENFLLIEDGSTDKIFVFCSTEAKDTINRVSDYYADGTFKVAPKPFMQIYSLHGEVGGNPIIVPLVFALLPNKQETTYERLFTSLRQHLPQMNPLHFHSDFEMAAMNAFQKVFPCVTVHGCFFHYIQALRKNAKKANLYNTKEQETIALYTALAHLPPAHIPEGFLSINFEISSDNTSAWNDFVGYYVKQWMKYDTVAIMSSSNHKHRRRMALQIK